MNRILLVAAALAFCVAPIADARELGRQVHRKDGKNVVESTGEALDFRLTAERDGAGAILVSVTIPGESDLQKASYLRLEVRRDKQILLWSRLVTRKGDGGALTAGFQIHESLAKDAYVAIAYDAAADRRGGMFAYQVPVAEYIAERKAQAK
jgi:hypothetical protein